MVNTFINLLSGGGGGGAQALQDPNTRTRGSSTRGWVGRAAPTGLGVVRAGSRNCERRGAPPAIPHGGGNHFYYRAGENVVQAQLWWRELALCALWTIGHAKLWRAQLLNNTNSSEITQKSKAQAGAPRRRRHKPEERSSATTPGHRRHGGCTRSRWCPKLRKKFRGGNFDTKLEDEAFPRNLSPDEAPPPPPV